MGLGYEGWSRSIDLSLRARYPYLNTRIFKISEYDYLIYIENEIEDFNSLIKEFNVYICYASAPIKLVNKLPNRYEKEISKIEDKEIPSQFQGFPFTKFQLSNHVECVHQGIEVTRILENRAKNRVLTVELKGEISNKTKSDVQATLNQLQGPYSLNVVDKGTKKETRSHDNMVLEIVSSSSQKHLKAKYLERDEELWFKNVEDIYKKKIKKDDLFYYDSSKTSCLVDFSKFLNLNIRNHLLLYDTVYCVFPLSENMQTFLEYQKISRDEILHLVSRGRLKIINTQPEDRLDFGFLNEIYETDQSAIISRRAISALCAIDIVEISSTYIFNDSELQKIIMPVLKGLASASGINFNDLINYIFWPKIALRNSFNALHISGPKGIAAYGVNQSLTKNLKGKDSQGIEFEFAVSSDSVHIANALDSTYFPFFTKYDKYTDHPYALMMGNMLNFYKTANIETLRETVNEINKKEDGNPSIQLISIFDINEYIPIDEFESEVASSVIRKGMNSLFKELSKLNEEDRKDRIKEYNSEIQKALSRKKISRHSLDLGKDLGKDAVGVFLQLPFIYTVFIHIVKKYGLSTFFKSLKTQFPKAVEISEYIENMKLPKETKKRRISLLTKINRVARLKEGYD